MKLARLTSEDESQIDMMFYCPGCKCNHSYRIKGKDPVWSWNGDTDKPTFSPSLMVWRSRPEIRCHLYVENGMIRYLGDCHHELASKTVPMEDVDEN